MKKTYFGNLDALRFFAFFAVFLFHSFYTPFEAVKSGTVYQLTHFLTRSGELGVNFFFVLSGFLITYLLLDEEKRTGKIDLPGFYMRRILRIWPLYFAIVLFCFFVYPYLRAELGEHPAPETSNPRLFWAFLSNFDNIYNGSQTPSLYILWSVSIEEQFYLVWPLLIKAFSTNRKWVPMAAVIAISLVARFYYLHDDLQLHFNTLCVTGDMAAGGLLAWLVYCRPEAMRKFHKMTPALIGLVYAAGFLLVLTRIFWAQSDALRLFERLLLSLFFVFIIFEQNYAERSLFKAGRLSWITGLGKVTYGLYCYHYLCLLVAVKLNSRMGWNQTEFGVVVLDNLVGLVLAIVVATLSYRLFEVHFLKLKTKFEHGNGKLPLLQYLSLNRYKQANSCVESAVPLPFGKKAEPI